MQFINHTEPKLLLADEGKQIRDKNDVYTPATENEEEHLPYYSTVVFVGNQITSLEQCQELYVEEIPENQGI